MNEVTKQFVRAQNGDWLERFTCEQDPWTAGLELIFALRRWRISSPCRAHDREADARIAQYCRMLRQSFPLTSLSRLQRDRRLCDEQLVTVLWCVLRRMGFLSAVYPLEPANLVCGPCPQRLRRYYQVLSRGAIARGLLFWSYGGELHVTGLLMSILGDSRPIGEADVRRFMDGLDQESEQLPENGT